VIDVFLLQALGHFSHEIQGFFRLLFIQFSEGKTGVYQDIITDFRRFRNWKIGIMMES